MAAFRCVMELLECAVMDVGLKGAPATLQRNVSACLQPLLGQGVIACLNDALVYSPDLPIHADLLQQLLSTFFKTPVLPEVSHVQVCWTRTHVPGIYNKCRRH